MHLRYAVRAWLSLGGERRAVSAERASLVHEAGTGEDQAASPAHELVVHELVRFGYGSFWLRLAELLDQPVENDVALLLTSQLV